VGSGNPSLAAGAPRGALSIVTQGWWPSTVAVGAGDYIGLGGRLYIATAAVAASGAGTATIAIAPPLRAAVVVGEPLILSLPSVAKVFEGAGSIGAISDVEETVELRAVRLTLALSPVPQEVVDIALAERSYRLRPVTLWGALLDAQGAFVADPFPLWAGLMDTMEVTDGAEPSVALACESRLVDLERAEVRRYTDADQQAEFPGDRFFEFVPALQEAEIRLPNQ
jgi:hypothetical protein